VKKTILTGAAILAIAVSIGSAASACGDVSGCSAGHASLRGNAPTTSFRPMPRPAYFYMSSEGRRRYNRSTNWGTVSPLFNVGYDGYGGSSTRPGSYGYSHDNFAAEAEQSDAEQRAGAEARVMAGLDALMPSPEFLTCAQVGFPGAEAPAATLQAWFLRIQQECPK
jgi:hypothetical protein